MGERNVTDSRILEAALAEFAHKGKDGARTQRIADAAGINKAMLHYYYRTKERLYEAAFDFVFKRLLVSFGRSVQEADSFAVMLERFIDGYMSFVRSSPVIVRFLVAENLEGGDVMGKNLKRLLESREPTLPQILIKGFEEAVERGEIRPVDPWQTVLSVLSICIFPMIIQPTLAVAIEAKGETLDDFWEARRRHAFELIYHGLKADPDREGSRS